MNSEIRQIAERLRGLRDVLGLSIHEVATTAGYTDEEYLKVEKGESDISVAALQNISRKYGIALDVLMFGQEPKLSSYFLTRADAGVSIERRKAYKYQSLASGFRGRTMEPFLVTVSPKDTDEVPLNRHDGQEFIMVKEGTLEITVGTKKMILEVGDSIYLNSELPHGMRALGGKDVKFLTVVC